MTGSRLQLALAGKGGNHSMPSMSQACVCAWQMLQRAHQATLTSEQQREALELERQNQEAATGRALVHNAVSIMQEATEQIRAAFLLPRHEIQCVLHRPLLWSL